MRSLDIKFTNINRDTGNGGLKETHDFTTGSIPTDYTVTEFILRDKAIATTGSKFIGNLEGSISLPSNSYQSNSEYGIDANNSDIIGLNGLYFDDAVDSAGEGINFYRDGSTWDRIWANNGNLYFTIGETTGTTDSGTKKTVAFTDSNITGNAATATKIGTTTVGSSTKPVYISNGTPTQI